MTTRSDKLIGCDLIGLFTVQKSTFVLNIYNLLSRNENNKIILFDNPLNKSVVFGKYCVEFDVNH